MHQMPASSVPNVQPGKLTHKTTCGGPAVATIHATSQQQYAARNARCPSRSTRSMVPDRPGGSGKWNGL